MKYNKLGQEADDGDKVFAEELDGSAQTVYYVLTYNNVIYDPLGPDSNRESKLNTQLKRTSANTFNSYIKYLQTKNRIYITQATRSFMNG